MNSQQATGSATIAASRAMALDVEGFEMPHPGRALS